MSGPCKMSAGFATPCLSGCDTHVMVANTEASGRRRPSVVVVGLAALAGSIALLGLTQTLVALAFAWGYVTAGVVVGGVCLVTLTVVLMARRRQRR